MDEISVKVWGVAGDGSELIKASDAQAVLSVMNMQFLALSNERDLLLSKLRTTNEYCLTNCVDGGETKDKVIELTGQLEQASAERNHLKAQLNSLNEYCVKNGFEFIRNSPVLTIIHEIGKARRERDALATHVEALRDAATDAANALGFLSHHLRGRVGEASLLDMAEKADAVSKALSITPQQCLAEIKADALKNAADMILKASQVPPASTIPNMQFRDGIRCAVAVLSTLAEKVRKGGE